MSTFFYFEIIHSFFISFWFATMDWTQRHQAAMDEVRPDHGINVDDAMTIPSFSLMERLLVIVVMTPICFIKT